MKKPRFPILEYQTICKVKEFVKIVYFQCNHIMFGLNQGSWSKTFLFRFTYKFITYNKSTYLGLDCVKRSKKYKFNESKFAQKFLVCSS